MARQTHSLWIVGTPELESRCSAAVDVRHWSSMVLGQAVERAGV